MSAPTPAPTPAPAPAPSAAPIHVYLRRLAGCSRTRDTSARDIVMSFCFPRKLMDGLPKLMKDPCTDLPLLIVTSISCPEISCSRFCQDVRLVSPAVMRAGFTMVTANKPAIILLTKEILIYGLV